MIWGDVFFTEVKGSFRKIYTVSITDYTGSINLKIRAQEGEDCSSGSPSPKGTTVVVRGDCSYDKYEHDYIVWPYDVLFVERKSGRTTPPSSGWSCICIPSCPAWTLSAIPAASSSWPTGWATRPSPSLTTASVRGYPRPCWRRTPSTRQTRTSSSSTAVRAYFVDDMIPCVYGVKDEPLNGEFCVFDTETTGLDPGVEYLTEIGAVIVRNGEVVEEFDTFVKPGKPITSKITELTGITNEMVADAPGEAEALKAFLDFVDGPHPCGPQRPLLRHPVPPAPPPSGAASSLSRPISTP